MAESLFSRDFGQKVDLCSRIREILRNYPEGSSVWKESARRLRGSQREGAGAHGSHVVEPQSFRMQTTRVPASASSYWIFGPMAPNHSSTLASPSSRVRRACRVTWTSAASHPRGVALRPRRPGVQRRHVQRAGFRVDTAHRRLAQEGGAHRQDRTLRRGLQRRRVSARERGVRHAHATRVPVYHVTEVPTFVSGSRIVMFDPQATHVPHINPGNPGTRARVAPSALGTRHPLHPQEK